MSELTDDQFLGAPARAAGEMTDEQFLGAPSTPAPTDSANATSAQSTAAPDTRNPFIAAITDIPSEIGSAASSAASTINNNLNPFSSAYQARVDAASKNPSFFGGMWEDAKNTLGTAQGVAAIPALVASPVTGASRSLIGHTLAGVGLSPNYEQGKSDADMMMSAIAPGKGVPSVPDIPAPTLAKPGIIGSITEPFTAAGQERMAARKLAGAFTDPQAATAELAKAAALQEPGAGLGEIVPGSKPTTGQLTGDLGGLSLEREMALRQPDLYKNNEFGTGSEQQNAARTQALSGIQPTGSPEAIGDVVRRQMADIDAQHTATVAQATTNAQQAASGIGAGAAPEDVGANLRATLQAARDAAKVKERALWNAVDPDGTLALPATPVTDAAKNIVQSLPSTAKPMAGEESAIFQTAAALPPVAPFSDITALRGRISAAMRQELVTSGQSPTYARLSQLRGALEDAITNAVDSQAAQEQSSVSAGAISPEETAEARVRDWVAKYTAQKNAATADGIGSVGNSGAGNIPLVSASRTARQTGIGFRDNAGPAGVQGQALSLNLDEAAAARLAAASAATKARATIFDNGPVGEALRKGQNASEYRAPDSLVPNKFFATGPSGAERVEAYRKAVGDSGMTPLHDAAAESLYREAMTPDGVVDPKKFAAWQAKHQDALRALPPQLSEKFSNAANASNAVADAAEARKAAIDGYQKSIAGKFLGITDPKDVSKTVANIFGKPTSVRDMASLARRVSGDPDAKEGLRKTVADMIIAKSTGTTEAGTSGVNNLNASTFQKFLRDNAQTIKASGFSDRELGSMQAIAQDIQRSQRTMSATKLPNSPGTAQDVLKSIESAQKHREISLLTKIGGGAYLGWEHGGFRGALAGAALGGGEHLLASLRGAGIAKANTLVRDAMLNPELAMTLLKKAPFNSGKPAERQLARLLAKSAMFSAYASSAQSARQSH